MFKKEIYGMNAPVLLAICGIVIITCLLGVLPTTFIGAMAICMVLGFVLGWIGDRIPIWKDYFGGGAILAYFGAAALVKFNFLPEKTVTSVTNFIGGYDFLTVFIAILLAGSIMTVNRKLLIRAISGYIPAILAGIVGAMIFGVIGGLIVGVNPGRTLTMYVLPIMGGGTGAGALPMSDMFASITGQDKTSFLSFAMPILAIGNIFAIIAAALLNKLGKKKPNLSGEGELVKTSANQDLEEKTVDVKVGLEEVGMGFMVVFGLYMLSVIFSKKVLPSIGGVSIHTYAYMVLFTALCNIFNVFSPQTLEGLKKLQKFFTSNLLLIIMFSCGVAYINFDEVIAALTLSNVFISACVVLGCIIGSGLWSYVVNFYPIETAITAGLCMANTGGTGDIAVLGACKRMNLMAFAQISSRIGGGIMLVVASIVFAIFLK